MADHFSKARLKLLCRYDVPTAEAWFEEYCDILYTHVYYRFPSDTRTAATVVEKTFVQALKQIETYDPSAESMPVWLVRIAGHFVEQAGLTPGGADGHKDSGGTSRDINRKIMQATEQSPDKSLMDSYTHLATEPLPEEIIQATQTAYFVRAALADIPIEDKQLLKDYYYHIKTAGDIAAVSGRSEEQVNAGLYNARRAFRDAFIRLCRSVGGADDGSGAWGRQTDE